MTRIKSLIILLVMLTSSLAVGQTLTPTPTPCPTNCPTGYSDSYKVAMTEFMGIVAYSNGPCTGGGCGYFQCVEYIKRFYSTKFGIDIGVIGQAKYMFGAAQADTNKFLAYPNGTSIFPPLPMDILCYGCKNAGHVGIVTKVDFVNGYIWIIDQNRTSEYPNGVNNRCTLIRNADGTWTVQNDLYLLSKYCVQGWVRSKDMRVGLFQADPKWTEASTAIAECYLRGKNRDYLGSPFADLPNSTTPYVHYWVGPIGKWEGKLLVQNYKNAKGEAGAIIAYQHNGRWEAYALHGAFFLSDGAAPSGVIHFTNIFYGCMLSGGKVGASRISMTFALPTNLAST